MFHIQATDSTAVLSKKTGSRMIHKIRSRIGPLLALVTLATVTASIAGRSGEPLHMAVARTVVGISLRLHGASIKRYPVERLQQAANDCALTAVRELVSLKRLAISTRDITRALPIGISGISLNDLASGMSSLGMNATVLRSMKQEQVMSSDIVLLTSRHYVLVTRIGDDRIEYFDPMIGEVSVTMERFVKTWTGKAVRIQHSAPDPTVVKNNQPSPDRSQS